MDSDRRDHLPGSSQAVYAISVAAELAGVGVQTLRLYEQHGLVTPARSAGGTRRYSGDDLARLERIVALVSQGINLAGIARILELEDANTALTAERDRLRARHEANVSGDGRAAEAKPKVRDRQA
ncbi:MerR family transcriptional regulator [Rhodococcus sp. NPDC003382]|uniref:MerR family transcriptional regulator n=1 Tax=unclassified Rhodococcus (in: high G+C Gram-positive bacteria) TaxID=192944 RepID=UPI0018CF4411|nr:MULTISPECIES: MerR family transcriptional regulator [unclassified Rhodococcus (in: high G+C Gram-positive bacteria)]MBH0120413.1 MerR family transcriptional regulator [Rhodococcus sp. CX]MCK8673846.1 MerR family transcriptional regulator [Rhodococcus sp. HM1]